MCGWVEILLEGKRWTVGLFAALLMVSYLSLAGSNRI